MLSAIATCFGLKKGKAKVNEAKSPLSDSSSTKDIDFNMKVCETRSKRTLHILLLGPGDSGKTTIVKQMKKINATLDQEQLNLTIPLIQKSILTFMKLLCAKSQELEDVQLLETNTRICDQLLNAQQIPRFDENLGADISSLWADPAIKAAFEFRKDLQMPDHVDYFLDRVSQIMSVSYLPTDEDFLRLRSTTTGVNTEVFKMQHNFGESFFEFTDVGGQRSERKKWMSMMTDHMQAILFVVAIGDYDMTCYEDNTTNRLQEALDLFEELVKKNFFKGKSVILFLNKYDNFEEKIKQVPITVALPDFPEGLNPHDATDVSNYVRKLFEQRFNNGQEILYDVMNKPQTNKDAPQLHTHHTTALDTDNIQSVIRNVVGDVVKRTLLQNNLL